MMARSDQHGKICLFFGILLCQLILTSVCPAASSSNQLVVIPLSGTVDPGMSAFLKRALESSADGSNPLYIIEIDTFGGRVDSALQIVDTLLTVPKEQTIGFVKTKAISAGALIALACGRLVMKKNTTIGDCAPIT